MLVIRRNRLSVRFFAERPCGVARAGDLGQPDAVALQDRGDLNDPRFLLRHRLLGGTRWPPDRLLARLPDRAPRSFVRAVLVDGVVAGETARRCHHPWRAAQAGASRGTRQGSASPQRGSPSNGYPVQACSQIVCLHRPNDAHLLDQEPERHGDCGVRRLVQAQRAERFRFERHAPTRFDRGVVRFHCERAWRASRAIRTLLAATSSLTLPGGATVVRRTSLRIEARNRASDDIPEGGPAHRLPVLLSCVPSDDHLLAGRLSDPRPSRRRSGYVDEPTVQTGFHSVNRPDLPSP